MTSLSYRPKRPAVSHSLPIIILQLYQRHHTRSPESRFIYCVLLQETIFGDDYDDSNGFI